MPWLTEFDSRQLMDDDDDKYSLLLSDLVFHSIRYNLKITAPYGLVSDGPSVPRVPLLYFLFGNKGKRSAVIHDWLYRCSLLSRAVCDSIFEEALIDSKKYKFTSAGMFMGVRIGGFPSYGGDRAGCLDPRITCVRQCWECPNYFGGYALTVVPYSA